MSKCNIHAEKAAVLMCQNCSKFVCEDCYEKVSDRSVCKTCIENGYGKKEDTPPAKARKISTGGLLLAGIFPGTSHRFLGQRKKILFFSLGALTLMLIHLVSFGSMWSILLMYWGIVLVDAFKTKALIEKGHYVEDNFKVFFGNVKSCALLIIATIALTPFNQSLAAIAAVATILFFIFAKDKTRDENDLAKVLEENMGTPSPYHEEEFMKEGLVYKKLLETKAESLRGTNIEAQVNELNDITSKIFAFVEKYPHKARQIEKFASYYLPTTTKLISNYEHIISHGKIGDNTNSATDRIENLLDSLQGAYKKQLDHLFADKALDIDAEAKTLSAILEQEGLLKWDE